MHSEGSGGRREQRGEGKREGGVYTVKAEGRREGGGVHSKA